MQEWSRGMRYARGVRLWCFVEQVGYGCCVYWPVCTLVPQSLLVAFLISIGHLFYITHCCPSIAQSHLEVGDVSVNFWYRCARVHGIVTQKMSCFFTAVETLDLTDSSWLPCACTK